MALSTLLEIVTRTCDELGLSRPSSSGVVASSLPQDRQMLALLNAAGRDLMASHAWSALIATASVATVNGTATYSMPVDFDRLLPDTGWDRTNYRTMPGNISPQRSQFLNSAIVVSPTTSKEYRITLNPGSVTFLVQPTPDAADTLSFLYVKNTWVYSNGSYVAEYALDADTTIYKPQLLVKELKWRFRNAKGLASTDLIAERNMLYDACVAADVGSGAIDMTGREPGMVGDVNLPDGSWNI